MCVYRQQILPVWHAANEDVRVGGELAEVELLAARRLLLRLAVDRQLRVLVVALDLFGRERCNVTSMRLVGF